MKLLLVLLASLFLGLSAFGQAIEDEVSFKFSDNSNNEDGFTLVSVEEDGSYTEIKSVEADITTITVLRSEVQGKRVAVLAFNKFGRSGITNVIEFGYPPNDPSGVVFEITFKQPYNAQIP